MRFVLEKSVFGGEKASRGVWFCEVFSREHWHFRLWDKRNTFIRTTIFMTGTAVAVRRPFLVIIWTTRAPVSYEFFFIAGKETVNNVIQIVSDCSRRFSFLRLNIIMASETNEANMFWNRTRSSSSMAISILLGQPKAIRYFWRASSFLFDIINPALIWMHLEA